jgi:hypothetical protein
MIHRAHVRSGVLSLFVVAAGCAHETPPPATAAPVATAAPTGPARAGAAAPPANEPTTEAGCHACKGEWALHGLSLEPSCLCPTSDAGKRCRDGVECQGQCLGDSDDRQVTDPGPPARGFFVGECSPYRAVFGCHRPIAAGALKAGPVPLDEPLAEICGD